MSTQRSHLAGDAPDIAILSPETLVARARALQPALRARAAEANKRRDVPKETIEDFQQAELFKVLRSARYGGFEGDPRTFFDIQNAIAEACASSAWVYGVLSVQYTILVCFDEKAQAEVSADNPDMLVSSAFFPGGPVKVETVEGGYRLSGRWIFSSGSTHAGWVLVGGSVPSKDGKPETRQFLLPRGDYRIQENWDTFGLCATGSNDIVIENAFVPAYRTIVPRMALTPPDDDGTPKSMLHRLPWIYLFSGCVANLSIGITRGAFRDFLEAMRTRISTVTGKAMKDDPALQITATRALVEADAAETLIRRHVADMTDAIKSGRTIGMQEALLNRVQFSSLLVRLAATVDAMQTMIGGRGIRNDSPLTRAWLDIMAARHHPANDGNLPAGYLAGMLFADPKGQTGAAAH